MSKGVLYFLLVIIGVALIATWILNFWAPSTMKPSGRVSPGLDQEIANPRLKGAATQAQAGVATSARPAPLLADVVLADNTEGAQAEPRRELPKVTSLQGNWGRNPFLTLDEIDFLRNPRKYDVEPEPPEIRLSTILTVMGKKTAVLNGHSVSVGDYIGKEKVVQIFDYSLVLQRENGKSREIRLRESSVELKTRPSRN